MGLRADSPTDGNLSNSEVRFRKRELFAARVQAVTTVIAVTLSVPGFWLAYKAYQQQSQTNDAQLRLNQIAQDRYERRFAARVAYWDDPAMAHRTDQLRLPVQNRAPVPLTNVRSTVRLAAYWGAPVMRRDQATRTLYVSFGTIPPCTVVTLSVPAAGLVGLWELPASVPASVHGATEWLSFSDPNGDWTLGTKGLQDHSTEYELSLPVTPIGQAFAYSAIDGAPKIADDTMAHTYTAEPIADCGEAN